jgi:phospholipid transport system substrate-binding protein
MNRQRKHIRLILLLVAFMLWISSESRAGEPLDVVKPAVDKVFQILGDPQLKIPEKKQESVERLKEVVNPIFDYDEMARRSLGQHWRRRTPAEQEEFAQLFRAFLERIYSDKVDV